MKIGFPIIIEGKECSAVWISTSDPGKENPKEVLWNGESISNKNPFGNNHFLNKFVREIINHRSIAFECNNLQYQINDNGERYVSIGDNSFGLALTLASRYHFSDMKDISDYDILLTGAVDESRKPLPILNQDHLKLKGRFAVENGCVLILVKDDYDKLDQKSGHLVASSEDSSKLPSSINELEESMKNTQGGRGRAYILPVNPHGKWNDKDKKEWVDGLGEFLGLKPFPNAQSVNSEKSLSSNQTDKNETNEDHSEYQIEPGTIAELYQAALPSKYHREYLSHFLKHNAKNCRKKLFTDGLGQMALKEENKKKLFPDDESVRQGTEYGHILIGGPTGCGKTFLTESLMLNTALELGQPVVYIAPTRALVYEIYSNLQERFKFIEGNNVFPADEIVFSSGEVNDYDWRIRYGKFKVGLIVNEKANIFLNADAELLKRVGLVIFDEVHMLSDNNRGGVLDMLVAKLMREQERRHRETNELIRIVFISTEDIINNNNDILNFFSFRSTASGSPEVRPVVISTEERPVRIKHRLQIYGINGRKPLDVVEFSKQSDRNIEYEELKEISRKAECYVDQINGEEHLNRHKPENPVISKSLIELICEHSKKYKKIVVVGNSTHRLKNYANAVANKRGEKKTNDNDMKEIDMFVSGGSLAKSEGDELINLVKRRIYLHNATLPQNVREWVEKRFREKLHEESPPEILFATETLAFGVNLATDCIILLDIRFPRESPDPDEDEEYKELSPNQYHNILGRAGRHGKVETDSLAEVCIPAYYHKKLISDMIFRCYNNKSRERKYLSTALLYSDIKKMKDNLITTLDDISYQSFRSVMDALRHVSSVTGGEKKYVQAKDIVSLFKKTIYWKTEPKDDLNTAERLIEKILEISAEYESYLHLVEADSTGKLPAYRILAQAEALIDTGTRWQSVSPIQKWLNRIREIKDSAAIDIPPELLVPAFVASRDLWPQIKKFCWEGRDDREPTDQDKLQNEESTRMGLVKELEKIEGILQKDVELIACHISKYVDELGSEKLKIKQPRYRKAAFYKSVTAFLMWIRGADLDSIKKLSLKHTQNRDQIRPFSQKYYEKASWIAVMCLRFFEGSTALLSEHFRELPRLSDRLRCGLPLKGLPFIQYKNSKAELQRGWVQKLLECDINASIIIKNENPSDLISSNDRLPEEIREIRKDIVDDVFEFYWKQIQILNDRMKKNANEQWHSFISLIENSFRKERGGLKKKGGGLRDIHDKDIKELARILDETFKIRKAAFPSEVKIIMQTDDKTIRFKKEGKEDLLFYVAAPDEDTTQLQSGKYIIIRMPWRNEDTKQTNIELTAFGGMVLAVLAGVEIIKFNSLFSRLHQLEPRTLSIKDIVKEFGEDTDFQAARETKEAMLMFNEPGV